VPDGHVTDPAREQLKVRAGHVQGYNRQAVVDQPKSSGSARSSARERVGISAEMAGSK
jgi:hypothetical protein